MLGFVGLGNMGLPMVKHLVNKGFSVGVWARRDIARAELESLGVQWFNSPQELAQVSDFFCTNVLGSDDVLEVLVGQHGALHGLNPGTICIDFSTINASVAQHISHRLLENDCYFLDSPVSGGIAAAQSANLTIMVGGERDHFDRAIPIYQALGKNIVYVGGAGAGQVAKACNQIIQVITIQGIAEAMLYAQANQVDLHKVLSAISTGFAGSRMLDLMGPKMADHNFTAAIEARLHAKDYQLISEESAALALKMPALELVNQQLQTLMDNGWGFDDTSSLLRVLEQQNQN